MGQQQHVLHVSCLLMYMLHCPIGLHLQNTSPKMTLLQISVCQQQSIKPNGGPSEHKGLCRYTGGMSRKPALSSTHPHTWSMSLPLTDETETHTRRKYSAQGPSARGPAGVPTLLPQTRGACVASAASWNNSWVGGTPGF